MLLNIIVYQKSCIISPKFGVKDVDLYLYDHGISERGTVVKVAGVISPCTTISACAVCLRYLAV